MSVIEDQHTGDFVCTDCAFVVDQVYAAGFPVTDKSCQVTSHLPAKPTLLHHVASSMASHTPKKQLYLDGGKLHLRETILDVCSQLHLEHSACLVDTVCHILNQLDVCSATFSLTNAKCRAKLAYAMFEALNRQGTPRSPQLIATHCDVTPKSLLHLEKQFTMCTTYCVPSQYIETACTMLELPYVVACVATMLCNHIQDKHYGLVPETLVAGTILAAVKRFRVLEDNEGLFHTVTTDALTDLFGIKARSITKVIQLLPDFTIVLQNSSELRQNEQEQFHPVLDRKKWSERKYDYWIIPE